MFCYYLMLVTLYGEVSFHFIGANGFHVKAENEGFFATGSRCHDFKYKIFTSLFG